MINLNNCCNVKLIKLNTGANVQCSQKSAHNDVVHWMGLYVIIGDGVHGAYMYEQ